MYLLAPFILQNFEKVPELWGCTIFGLKMAHLSWTNFFGTNHYYYFHLPIGLFHCAKFKEIFTVDPKLWGCAFFEPKWSICPKQTYFWKIIDMIFIYLLAPFIVQSLKKILPAELWEWTIFGPKMAHFFQKTKVRC